MADTQIITAAEPKISARPSETRHFFVFMVQLCVVMFAFRSFVIQPFSIPSESMMPSLLVGDYLIISKWPYGFSRASFPFSPPLPHGRVLSALPQRGDVVVFKSPKDGTSDIIKRVIGLPGDAVQVIDGQLVLNGTRVPRERLDDWVGTPTTGQPCLNASETLCHFARYRETLPNGRSYAVLDLGVQDRRQSARFTVPDGAVFMMGDNRDNSGDSRFTVAEGGVGLVPLDHLEGRAQIMFFSWDANGDWLHKIRWGRIGSGL